MKIHQTTTTKMVVTPLRMKTVFFAFLLIFITTREYNYDYFYFRTGAY